MTKTELRAYADKGIDIVKASRIRPGDRILVNGPDEKPFEVTVITVLEHQDGLRFLHEADAMGTFAMPNDEIMRLQPHVMWLGDFRRSS